MLKLNCKDNTITITRGDVGYLTFRTANYKLVKGDFIEFILWDKDDRTLFNKRVGDFNAQGFASIDIDHEESDQEEGEYKYTIRVITALGVDETVLEGTFKVVKGVI